METANKHTKVESEPHLNPRAHVLYHSPEWARLVESGWFTAWVFVSPNDGAQIAVMSREL